MLGRGRARVAPVVRGEHEEIVRTKSVHHPGHEGVELLEALRVADDVVAVSVLRVEVDEVREDEVVVAVADGRDRLLDAIAIRDGVHGRRDPASGENVLDLAEGMTLQAVTGRPTAERRNPFAGGCAGTFRSPPRRAGR